MDFIQQKKLFKTWNLLLFFLLFVLVLVGGFTRLTGSGLSITEWELFTGIFPPFSHEHWLEYFSLYKQIPQYKLINYNMTLEEFKFIFWWEYLHRLLARFLGLFYLIPCVYFIFNKTINGKNIIYYLAIFFLISFQGFMGWYMVSSGLVNNPDVSHFRLSIHLFIAVIILSLIFWSYLNSDNLELKLYFGRSSIFFYFFLFLIYCQIVLGAFTSGLDAGLIYQTWPLMNANFIAEEISIKSFFSLELFNDRAHVQFIHRLNAYFIVVLYLLFYFYNLKKFKDYILNMNLILAVLLIQIILGILTLLSGLNIYLAATHQIASLILVSSVILLIYKLKS